MAVKHLILGKTELRSPHEMLIINEKTELWQFFLYENDIIEDW